MFSTRLFSFRLITCKCTKKTLENLKKYCSSQCIVKSNYPSLFVPNLSLDEFIWRNLERWPDKTAIVCGETGKSFTYSEVKVSSDNLAYALREKMGMHAGEVVATIMPNYPDYCVTLLGCIKAGVVVTTINPIYTKDEIKKQLLDANVQIVFTISTLFQTVREAIKMVKKTIPIIVINTKQNESMPSGALNIREFFNYYGPRVDLGKRKPQDLTLLPYSSGTTGLPKGVRLSQRNLLVNLLQMQYERIRLNNETIGNQQDVVPLILPIYHAYALMIGFLNMFSLGCKLVLLPKYNPDNFLHLLDRYRPNVLHAVPPLLHFLSLHEGARKEYLERMQYIMSAAAPLAAEDTERFYGKFGNDIKILQGYGLTETSPISHLQRIDEPPTNGGAGWPVQDTECKVVSVEDNRDLSYGQTGEIYIRGPQVMMGYLNNEEATKESIDEEGWFKSGDIGHFDKDGQFYITDRRKELIKVKGLQVAPAELEAVLRDHPAIQDAAVVGIKHPYFGERPKAFVVPKPNTRLQASQVVDYVASKVAKYKQLTGGVEFIDSVPRNPSGKILRRHLKN